MSEGPPTVEQGPERIPTEEEVAQLFEKLTGEKEYTEIRKREDQPGLYLWDIKTIDEQGEVTEYSYMRAGQYPEGKALRSAIHVAFYDSDGMPIGGHSVAKYIDGEWHISEDKVPAIEQQPEVAKVKTEEQLFEKDRAQLVENLGYTVIVNEGKFLTVAKAGYRVRMKHFKTPSEFGIENGRISAIEISKDGKVAMLWERGETTDELWDDESEKIFTELVTNLN